MALESGNPSGARVHAVCPLYCSARQGATNGSTPADQVDWAGLPVNLDLAFSPNQRDKVYAQHMKFRRAVPLRRRAQDTCICEIAQHPDLNQDTRKSASGW